MSRMDKPDNEDNILETFNRLKQNRASFEVGGDFENQVFTKIKQKKKQRKVAASTVLGVAVVGFIFLGQSLLFHKPGPDANTNNIAINSLNEASELGSSEKEEIPVLEEVVFASSDSASNYIVEQVGASLDDNSI